MNISNCMRTQVILAEKSCDFKSLLCKLSPSIARQIYIVDGNRKLLGIVSSVDLLKEIIPPYLNADLARSFTNEADFLIKQAEKVQHKCAEEIMVKNFSYLHPQHQLLEADALIAEKGFNTLPVLDEQGILLGEISRRDVLQQLVNSHPEWQKEEDPLVDLAADK